MWDAAFIVILLLLSILTNVLLILLLLRSGQQNTAEDQTDEIARIVRDEVEPKPKCWPTSCA